MLACITYMISKGREEELCKDQEEGLGLVVMMMSCFGHFFWAEKSACRQGPGGGIGASRYDPGLAVAYLRDGQDLLSLVLRR